MISQSEEVIEISDHHPNFVLKINNNINGGLGDNNSGGLLNFSLGRNETSLAGNKDFPSKSATQKKFSCHFCKRKFYSSQALGGHQKAHKKERGMVNRHQYQRMMAPVGVPFCSPTVGSLGVQTHSLVHKPCREGTAAVARFSDANERSLKAWRPFLLEEAPELRWPRSFCMDLQQPKQPPESLKLDLSLRL